METTPSTTGRPGSHALAVALLWFTVAYNVGEGAVAITAGVRAGSVALSGFGLDSLIEVAAAAILIWRLGLPEGDARGQRRELVAMRVVGFTFFVLAAYIVAETAYVLATGNEPDTSALGIVLSVVSLAVMPALGAVKRWNATPLGSAALVAESMETLACSYLSATLLVGLGLNALFDWWWADIAAALAMLPWILKEGLEGMRGED